MPLDPKSQARLSAALPDPIWIATARKYIGLTEIPGRNNNQTIIGFWEAIKAAFRDDETPWCAAFVGACLEVNGIRSTRSAAARSYANFGLGISDPAYGCIVAFWRGSPTSGNGHVGFCVGKDAQGDLMILGGNQGNAVNIKPFSRARVLAYRWPNIAPLPARYDLPVLKSDGTVSVNEA